MWNSIPFKTRRKIMHIRNSKLILYPNLRAVFQPTKFPYRMFVRTD